MESVPYDDAPRAGGLKVITLSSAPTPMPLHVPFLHELEGFTVFRSHVGEGDSTVYYLHVGYFADDAAARTALEIIRGYYPFATIEPAPGEDLGSLDDTLTTEFRMLRTAQARVVPGRAPARRLPTLRGKQQYAVLLARRSALEARPTIPRLPAFRTFILYGVRASADDGECQDIRIGFFDDVVEARLFAESIRGEFPQAAALPVSDREVTRIRGLSASPQGDALRAAAGG